MLLNCLLSNFWMNMDKVLRDIIRLRIWLHMMKGFVGLYPILSMCLLAVMIPILDNHGLR